MIKDYDFNVPLEEDEQDHPSIIPENEHKPELEREVKHFMSITPDLPVNTKLYTRNKIPEGLSLKEQVEWERQELNRCKVGYDGMAGKQYTYFQYGYIQQISGGRITPEYRVADNDWYKKVEEVQGIKWDIKTINGYNTAVPVNESKGEGLVCVKRRRGGFSWKEALDSLHDSAFIPFFNTGMNSKSERDSIILFNKVKFLYDNIEAFIRPTTTAGKTKNSMDFSYYGRDAKGNKIKKGTQSNIVVVPPTDNAYEGWMLNKWCCDEGGKIPNLEEMYTYTEDCMMEETLRKGTPIIFGTAGDIGNIGKGLKDMYDNAHVYRLQRYFFGGWMGILCDQYGNDLKEHAIRWIIYERERRNTLSLKKQNQFKQRYPLTIKEAFAESGVTGIGDPIKINAQVNVLKEARLEKKRGEFRENPDTSIEFIPHNEGPIIMYEDRDDLERSNVAGCDPVDHDNTTSSKVSSPSLLIMRKPIGTNPPRLLLDYTHRPSRMGDYYYQAGLALKYYNNTKVLIERNRFRMISEFESMGLKYLMHYSPQKIMRLVGGRVNTIGVNMTDPFRRYVEGLTESYIDDYSEDIPSIDLLEAFLEYDPANEVKPDRVIAFMLCMAMLWEDRSKVETMETTKSKLRFPTYVKKNGVIVRSSSVGKEIVQKQRTPFTGGVGIMNSGEE